MTEHAPLTWHLFVASEPPVGDLRRVGLCHTPHRGLGALRQISWGRQEDVGGDCGRRRIHMYHRQNQRGCTEYCYCIFLLPDFNGAIWSVLSITRMCIPWTRTPIPWWYSSLKAIQMLSSNQCIQTYNGHQICTALIFICDQTRHGHLLRVPARATTRYSNTFVHYVVNILNEHM